ncbi:MAG: acyl-CoA reductase [Pseudomonadota bacterium]
MNLNEHYQVVCPRDNAIEHLIGSQLLDPFSEETLQFTSALSSALMRDGRTAGIPEVTALAFWMRKANVISMQKDFLQPADNFRLPRGTVFHIAPSNVDTIFVYSLFLSLFCGNRNIVRISSTPNAQVDAILAVMNDIISAHPVVAQSMMIVRYEHSEEVSRYFSSLCDVRMIWGGDETIRRIRSIPLPPRAKELTFADRFSLAVLDAEQFLNADDSAMQSCIEGFYRDSYWFDQMACSSPRLVCWRGGEQRLIREAQTVFWNRVEELLVTEEYSTAPALAMDKLVAQCRFAIEAPSPISIEKTSSLRLARVESNSIPLEFREVHCGGGLFLEIHIESLADLLHCVDQKVQTMTCFGIDKKDVTAFLAESKPSGIDRVVKFGDALNFSEQWDGYGLLNELTRCVDVQVL